MRTPRPGAAEARVVRLDPKRLRPGGEVPGRGFGEPLYLTGAAAARTAEQLAEVAAHFVAHDPGHQLTHASPNLGLDVAGQVAGRAGDQTDPTAAAGEALLLAPRVVGDRSNTELPFHLQRRQPFLPGGRENGIALPARIGLPFTTCLGHEKSSHSVGIPRSGPRYPRMHVSLANLERGTR